MQGGNTMALRSLIVPYASTRDTPALRQQDPFMTLRNQMDRLFDSFGTWPGEPASDITPRVDVCETDKELDIDAELPGMEDKDIDVTLSGDMLTIRGETKFEHEENKKNFHISERSYGSFSRSIHLPFDADPKNVTAKFEKGVLHIAIPKPEHMAAETAKIPVKGA
jgi:HSP20 family protein